MLNVIMLMEKFSKHDYSGEAKDLIVLLFVFIKQKKVDLLSRIAIYILIEDINLTRNYSP